MVIHYFQIFYVGTGRRFQKNKLKNLRLCNKHRINSVADNIILITGNETDLKEMLVVLKKDLKRLYAQWIYRKLKLCRDPPAHRKLK